QVAAQDRSAAHAAALAPASEPGESPTSVSEVVSSVAVSAPYAIGAELNASGTDPDTAEADADVAATGSRPAETGPSPAGTDGGTPQAEEPPDDGEASSRSRRMPIVQPPSTAGVRVVTAASAQGPDANAPED